MAHLQVVEQRYGPPGEVPRLGMHPWVSLFQVLTLPSCALRWQAGMGWAPMAWVAPGKLNLELFHLNSANPIVDSGGTYRSAEQTVIFFFVRYVLALC